MRQVCGAGLPRFLHPTRYDELLLEIGRLKYLTFTGSAEILMSLQDHDPLFTWGGKIWDALCALEEYGQSSLEWRCDRDVDGYLRHRHGGRHRLGPLAQRAGP